MDMLDLIAAYAISQGVHTGGHFNEAARQEIPIRLDVKNFKEVWRQPDNRKDADLNGAGFQAQDDIKTALHGTKEGQNAALLNAIIKGSYLAGVPGLLSKNSHGFGDIENMERTSGNKYTKGLIAGTLIDDLATYLHPEKKWSVGFSTFGTGQPGLKVNFGW